MSHAFADQIFAREVLVGKGVEIGPGTTLGEPGAPLERLILGDNVYIGENCKFRTPVVEIGDYTQVHGYALVNGYKPLTIGHNCWFGQNTILNSTDRLQIGNNCGVGAYSQLWTHMAYGDVLQGCRWDSTKPMTIGDDVWFVGHCIVSPITAGDRSMAMLGSLVTKDMEADRIYAGSPAKDMTDKMGSQFEPRTVEERVIRMSDLRAEFLQKNPTFNGDDLGISADGEVIIPGRTAFDVVTRGYTKCRSEAEVAFIRFLLPKAKFVPTQ